MPKTGKKISVGIKKEVPTLLCLSLVTAFLFLTFRSTFLETRVCVDPKEKTAHLSDTFAINVNVIDVVDLSAYNFIIYYDTIPVDGVSLDFPPGHFLEPIHSPENLLITHKEIEDNYNATHGRVWVSVKLRPENPWENRPKPRRCLLHCVDTRMRSVRTGSGILFSITFRCTGSGASILNLYKTQLFAYGNSTISHTRSHGLINACS